MARVKTFVAGGTLFPDDLNAIQDYIDQAAAGVSKTFTWGKDYTLAGPINVASGGSGEVDYILPFFMPIDGTQTTTLYRIVYKLQIGTGVGFDLKKLPWGGSESSLFSNTPKTVSPTAVPFTFVTPVPVADLDSFRAVVSSPSGGPTNMTLSMHFRTVV